MPTQLRSCAEGFPQSNAHTQDPTPHHLPKWQEQERTQAALNPEWGRGQAWKEDFGDTGETLSTDSVLLVPTQPWKSRKAS